MNTPTDQLRSSERQFSNAFAYAAIGMALVAPHGRYLKVNRALCQMLGYDEAELLARTYQEITHPEDQEDDGNVRQLLAGDIESFQMEKRYLHRRGHQVWGLLSVSLVRDEAGQPVNLIAQIQDITERKKTEDQLKASFKEIGDLKAAVDEHAIVAITDPQGKITYVNDKFCAISKYSRDELLGQDHRIINSRHHPREFIRDLWATITGGKVWKGEIKNKAKDGSFYWVDTTIVPILDEHGRPHHFVAIRAEITDRKRATEELRESHEKFEQLANHITDAFWIRSPDMREVHYISPAFERIWGRSPQSLRANPQQWIDFTLPEDRARVAGAFTALTGDTPSIDIEYRIMRPDGEIRWVRVRGFQVRDAAEKLIRLTGIVIDITAQKQAEAALAKAHQELVDVSRQAGMAEVATSVLHNVGNVLNSVNVSATLVADHVRRSKAGNVAKLAALLAQHKANLGDFLTNDARGQMIPDYLDTLAKNLDAENQAIVTELEHLRINVEHIKEIVAMQQTYARSSGVIETISVPDMLEDALRINAGSLARHNVDTIRDYQARPVITTDRHKVVQILINLVRNAQFACVESGRTGRQITVRTTSDDRCVKIAVIDNGIGIPAENLTRIFNQGFTTRKNGHGFGLHTGALAARELGGSLSVESDGPDRGASFILQLPLAPETPTP